MSLLQRKNIHKRHLLWVKLFGICLFFHILFLWWIFCIYRDNSYVLSLSVHKKLDYSAPVVFVPLGTQTTSSFAKATKDKATVAPKKQITSQNNKSKVTPTPSLSKPEVKKTTTVAAAPVKKIDNPKPTLNTSLAVADVKKIEPLQETVKQEKKPETTEQKKIEQSQDIKTNEHTAPVIPENAQVSHNYREVEALRMQAQLQKEIVQTWKPPIGVSPDCSCDVSFFVTTTGALNHIKMVKPSGVMMFDISARQALCATKMPHWTYGKTLTITFKQ